MARQAYINFPIQLISGLLVDKTKTMNHWLYYWLISLSDPNKIPTDEDFSLVCDNAGISVGNISSAKKTGFELWLKYSPKSNPIVGLEKEMFFDFYHTEKSEIEMTTLAAFLAIKSIVGNKPYIKTGNDFLVSRMDGHLKRVALGKLSKELKKWSSVYKLQKVKSILIESWGLVHYSRYMRGFYVSFQLNLDKLAEIAESKRIESRAIFNYQRQLENEARDKALGKLFHPFES